MPVSFCFANLRGFRFQNYFNIRGACLYGYELGMLCIYTANLSLFKMLVVRPTVVRCLAAH